ncbi:MULTISPECIES: NAD-dependent epimerase/dehydratase family protein [Cyanophyceae]|uniref:NAD-dependent epimerase/dehydratase family protein n=1 Tax=Cyanophyceae TaxID=3028117 RepID=UPI001683B380|nr:MULTISPECIES: NAD-dependent epimerase/dehydratase family protein [Cyanophyceae]MBD1918173.1 NAD-dependent epimerase/dehydratase family protein [Phormidium sp. FACHB-77]MBD2030205.1 NAD-dependent epimerase/dehydratase family protein [Phormidium sp. FACHB-322]MBD2051423.1 NAD-dependent epimerase/dehydratase family protein [Leptolyngbya sp. FACHB-60]
MNFLVTGGAGFIGSHLIEELLAAEHRVTVIDNLSTGKYQNLMENFQSTSIDQLTFVESNAFSCDLEKLSSAYDGLVHLAATPSVTQSWEQPVAAHENNVSGTIAMIQICQKLAIPRLVFASSAAVYGNPCQVPISENELTTPISPYGLQKLSSEQYITLFSKHLGISSVNLRLFNVFGLRQDPKSPYSGVISIFAKAMSQGMPIFINGDGSQTRDFICVKDVAIAFAKALTLPLPSGTTLTCNIGSGQAISLLQLIEELRNCFPEWTAGTSFNSPRLGDIQHSQADVTRAKQYLAFEPRFTIRDGLMVLRKALN